MVAKNAGMSDMNDIFLAAATRQFGSPPPMEPPAGIRFVAGHSSRE